MIIVSHELKGGQKRFGIPLKTFVGRIAKTFLIADKSRTDIAPIRSLREIDYEIDVFSLPGICDRMMFVLRFNRI